MRDARRNAAILAAAIGLSALSLAAEVPAESVTFEAAVRRAVENNHDVARATTAILGADALLDKARAVILPSLEAYASETVVDEERGFDGIVTQPRDQLAVDPGAARPGMLEFLEHDDAGAFAQHEPVAVAVVGA